MIFYTDDEKIDDLNTDDEKIDDGNPYGENSENLYKFYFCNNDSFPNSDDEYGDELYYINHHHNSRRHVWLFFAVNGIN